jgi:hypothetical protein
MMAGFPRTKEALVSSKGEELEGKKIGISHGKDE